MNLRFTCSAETSNPRFCSRTCSAITNNKLYKKRTTKKVCIVCNKKVSSYKNSRCNKCKLEYERNLRENKTIEEFKNSPSVKNKHPSWASVYIRHMCRYRHKHLTRLPCAKCGYTKHVELAHIKPVASFPPDTLIKEVNASTNIIQLCPNCHWELDHGLIQLS